MRKIKFLNCNYRSILIKIENLFLKILRKIKFRKINPRYILTKRYNVVRPPKLMISYLTLITVEDFPKSNLIIVKLHLINRYIASLLKRSRIQRKLEILGRNLHGIARYKIFFHLTKILLNRKPQIGTYTRLSWSLPKASPI